MRPGYYFFLLLTSMLSFSAADAVTVILKLLMCYESTAEPVADEVYIEIHANERLMETLGPQTMWDGFGWNMHHDISNPHNYDVVVRLFEDDPYTKDDDLGSFTIRPEPLGEFTVDHPYELAGEHATHYRFTYEVTDEHTLSQNYYVKIQSATCNDAQEASDEIFINVNDGHAWSADNMKTGQTRDNPSELIQVPGHVKIEVWERDTGSDDLIGTYEFDITRDILRTTRSHTLSRDSGIVGDAKYTVTYFVAS